MNRPQVIIDEQSDFLSYLSSQNGDQAADVLEEEQYGEEVEEEEPKFPEQVYNVLLVGAAEVGQTSMILYVCFSTVPSDSPYPVREKTLTVD